MIVESGSGLRSDDNGEGDFVEVYVLTLGVPRLTAALELWELSGEEEAELEPDEDAEWVLKSKCL